MVEERRSYAHKGKGYCIGRVLREDTLEVRTRRDGSEELLDVDEVVIKKLGG